MKNCIFFSQENNSLSSINFSRCLRTLITNWCMFRNLTQWYESPDIHFRQAIVILFFLSGQLHLYITPKWALKLHRCRQIPIENTCELYNEMNDNNRSVFMIAVQKITLIGSLVTRNVYTEYLFIEYSPHDVFCVSKGNQYIFQSLHESRLYILLFFYIEVPLYDQ